MWDTQTTKTIFRYFTQRDYGFTILALAWSPDSRHLAFADWESVNRTADQVTSGVAVQVWDIVAKKQVRSYHGHILGITCIAWSPNGKRIAAGGDDETVQVWDSTSDENLLVYLGHQMSDQQDMLVDVAWSPNGQYIASTSFNETRIWKAP